MIDLSMFVGSVIALLLGVVVLKVWPLVEAILPPAALVMLQWVARSVVEGVEKDYAGEAGEVKRQEAFERIQRALEPLLRYMESHGYTVTPQRVYEAIEAAWRQMNTEQLLAGEKQYREVEIE